MWRAVRIFILLVILGLAIKQMFLDRADLAWKDNFYVALYPVNADGSSEVSAYIKTLSQDDFEPAAEYFSEEGQRYQVGLRRPVEFRLGQTVTKIPPAPPIDGSVLQVALWSLKFRFFALTHSPKMLVNPDIRLYLLYYNPETHPKLSHSTALNKGRIGRVNLFGNQTYYKQNLVILVHELLHTVNATDKYDLSNGLPIFPDGFAEATKMPLYPQVYAEIMGGRLPKTPTQADIPKSLQQTIIGEKTAREIGWRH